MKRRSFVNSSLALGAMGSLATILGCASLRIPR